MKIILIGYEPTHATELQRKSAQLIREGHDVSIITFDQELEWLLEEVRIPFISSSNYNGGERLQNIEYTEQLITKTRNRYLSRLSYRGVTLDTIFCFSLQIYIQKWLYFAEVFDEILEREKPDQIQTCVPFFSPSIIRDTFLYYENEVAVLCCMTLCKVKGVQCEKIGTAKTSSPGEGKWSNVLKVGLDVFNTCIGLIRRKQDIRLLASDYWRHIGPVFAELPSSTLTLYDRKEFRNISLKTIFQNRIRFMHGRERLPSLTMKRVSDAEKQLTSAWKSQKETLLSEHWAYRAYDMSFVIATALDDMMTYRLHMVLIEIERIFELLNTIQPHVVILRASVSAQSHFPILAQASRELGIPAIELQHGLENLAPGSISRHHKIEYIGLYGEFIRQEMIRATPSPRPQFSIIGSLDFDSLYSGKGVLTSGKGDELICIAPDVSLVPVYDTYDVFEYFNAVAAAARGAHMRVRIKLRGQRRQSFYTKAIRKAFYGVDYVIAENGTILETCRNAKIAVSCHSTAILELLTCGVPTVVAALTQRENRFVSLHFSQYEKKGALNIARTGDELSTMLAELVESDTLRESLNRNARQFMSHAFMFDGHAARRLATFITTLAKQSTPKTLK